MCKTKQKKVGSASFLSNLFVTKWNMHCLASVQEPAHLRYWLSCVVYEYVHKARQRRKGQRDLTKYIGEAIQKERVGKNSKIKQVHYYETIQARLDLERRKNSFTLARTGESGAARSSARWARDSSVRGRLRAVYILVYRSKKAQGRKSLPQTQKNNKYSRKRSYYYIKKDKRLEGKSRQSTTTWISSNATGRKRGLNRINLEWHVDTTKGRSSIAPKRSERLSWTCQRWLMMVFKQSVLFWFCFCIVYTLEGRERVMDSK